ncbi:tetratricopeptide repeat protein [Streptomyces spinoverrucosus]|uniref:tetratricopeptide repeat protein n=1 Tax=Streptomyces spinoverrucosus TaxID=284043 RepID=UPI0018C3AB6C|nr:tetratricopeptide repeat protein [Streptomyces spinoverrucosus]MBG0854892.1 tetratricopeptide repeat protein [Streptomyces spinoverrucosus]
METGVKTAVGTGTETGASDSRGVGRRFRRRRARLVTGVLLGLLVGALVVAWLLWPQRPQPRQDPPPRPGPAQQAMTAVTAGVPAALPDLAVLIGERRAHLRTHPKDARSWAVLGAAYVEQGRRTADAAHYPTAERALRTSLKVRPRGNAAALEGMAALANARRDFRAARTWGEAALKVDRRRWTTHSLLIEAYTGLGDYKAARSTLERLQGLHSGTAVMARSAAVYWDRGWREDAAATLADAAAKAETPAERAAWLERAGQLAWERGDREIALRHFQAAMRLDPDLRAAQAGQGRALAALGRTTEALSAYRAALAKQPSPTYALELGELYESLGMDQAAGVQYDLLHAQVSSAAAGGVDEELVLGRFEADHGDPGDAVRLLRAEWRDQPGIAVADALGWALHQAGEHEEALEYAERATDKEHGGGVRSALYAYHRGMIERALGLDGPARRHLEEALRINPYFSPLWAPMAREVLQELGEPPEVEVPATR